MDIIAAVENLLDNIYVRFGRTLYRQIVGVSMGINCSPLIADSFFYCCESQFMTKIQKDPLKQDLVDMFNDTCRYLDDVLALNNPEFQKFANEIYFKELTLNKSNISNDRTTFLKF